MTTINGVTFNMVNLRPVAVHRNSISEQPGSDTNFITDMGYDGLVLRLEGFEETLAAYDSVISEFMKSGEQTLVHRTGWQFRVYSAQLTPELIEGTVDNYFPYDLILLTSTPYRESTTLSCRAKYITANNQEWSAEDMPCDNLLDNWSFEDWSAGASSAPDGWIVSGTGVTIAKETSIVKNGSSSALLTYGSSTPELYQDIGDIDQYKSSVITAGAWVYCSVASRAYIKIDDGVGGTNSTLHTGSGDWEFLTVTRTIDASATLVRVGCRLIAASAYFDAAVLVEGDSIPDNTFIRDIDTDGSVDAVPDIQIVYVETPLTVDTEYASPGTNPTGLGFDGTNMWSCDSISNNIYKHNADMTVNATYGGIGSSVSGLAWDGSNMWSCDQALNKIYKHNANMTLNTQYNGIGSQPHGLAWDGSNMWSCDATTNKFYKHNVDMTLNTQYDAPSGTAGGLAWDGNHMWSCEAISEELHIFNADITVATTYPAYNSNPLGIDFDGTNMWSCDTINKILKYVNPKIKDVIIYNTEDTTVKCNVTNDVLNGSTHRINTDGTGIINHNDDFSDGKWALNSVFEGVSHDTINNELDISDDGYIYWLVDTKGPVTGIPTLTSQINITTGTPTIQISTDASTWYDITTAIVDDVDTVYELDSSSLHLKGQTVFYLRFDCVKAGAATCSIKSFEFDINIVTIDFENPKITSNGANTFRCDQDASSGMNCTVALIYRDRSWPA